MYISLYAFFPEYDVISIVFSFLLFTGNNKFILNRKLKVDFVLLAGYLKLIPNELVQAFPKSILNIHPSLLPAFGGKGFFGLRVHQAVIASGARLDNQHFISVFTCLVAKIWNASTLCLMQNNLSFLLFFSNYLSLPFSMNS